MNEYSIRIKTDSCVTGFVSLRTLRRDGQLHVYTGWSKFSI